MNFLYKQEIVDYDYYYNQHNQTILFLHGWGGNKISFYSTINLLKNKFNILTITYPTIMPTKESWTMQDYVDLTINILKTHNIKQVTIICHSFGFRVAMLLNHIINITKIVVTGGAGLKKESAFKRIERENFLLHLRNKNNAYLYNQIASSEYVNLSPTNKQTFKNVVNCNLKNFVKFNCPMLLFWGKKDTETKLWIAKKLKHNNNAKLVVTDGDHFVYLQKNALFNNLVLEFLK